MVAMAAYGAIWAVLSTTAPRIAEERQTGWLQQLRAMPVPAWQVPAAKVAAAVATALPAIIFVCTTAALAKGVSLTPGQWLALVAAMWVGSSVFAALGIAIGYAIGADSAYPVSYGLYMAMSATGGLWVPPAVLPATMASMAHALPSYQLAAMGWRIAAGQAPELSGVAILAAWGLGLAGIAVLAYRGRRGHTVRQSRRQSGREGAGRHPGRGRRRTSNATP